MYTTTFLFFIFHFLCQHLSAIVSLWRRQLYRRRVSLDGAALQLLQKTEFEKMPNTRCFEKRGRLESLSFIFLRIIVATVIEITQFSLFIWTWSPSFASKYREDSDSHHRHTRVWISRCFCVSKSCFQILGKPSSQNCRQICPKARHWSWSC